MGYFFNVGMTVFALNPAMDASVKDLLIDIEKAQVAFIIDPAEARVLMAEKAVPNVRRIGVRLKEEEKGKTYAEKEQIFTGRCFNRTHSKTPYNNSLGL
jgi:hypothetical protein